MAMLSERAVFPPSPPFSPHLIKGTPPYNGNNNHNHNGYYGNSFNDDLCKLQNPTFQFAPTVPGTAFELGRQTTADENLHLSTSAGLQANRNDDHIRNQIDTPSVTSMGSIPTTEPLHEDADFLLRIESSHGLAPSVLSPELTPQLACSDENIAGSPLCDDDFDVFQPGDDPTPEAGAQRLATDLRARKKKMKRFRLTHGQTRFLLGEFARQAHPDAAHRERLSREIPGLSARQVQVWFQNRRAKLKRLTLDDREQIMNSRAMPADFDTTKALLSPFETSQSASASFVPICGQQNLHYHSPASVQPPRPERLQLMPVYNTPGQSIDQHTPTSFAAEVITPPQSAIDMSSSTSMAGDLYNAGFLPRSYSESPQTHRQQYAPYSPDPSPVSAQPSRPQRFYSFDGTPSGKAEPVAALPPRPSMALFDCGPSIQYGASGFMTLSHQPAPCFSAVEHLAHFKGVPAPGLGLPYHGTSPSFPNQQQQQQQQSLCSAIPEVPPQSAPMPPHQPCHTTTSFTREAAPAITHDEYTSLTTPFAPSAFADQLEACQGSRPPPTDFCNGRDPGHTDFYSTVGRMSNTAPATVDDRSQIGVNPFLAPY